MAHSKSKRFQCDECNRLFRQKSGLLRHKRLHSGENTYMCDQCDQRFTTNSKLKWHQVSVHSKSRPFPCSECSLSFVESRHLKRHSLTHSGVKPDKCSQCNKSFGRKENLVRHKQIHLPENQYSCELCSKNFLRSDNLLRHLRSHTGEMPEQCNICKMRFAYRTQLKNHLLTHLESKFPSVFCPFCEKRLLPGHLAEYHIQQHTREKPFICKLCGAEYSHKATLRNHLTVNHGTKPTSYSCVFCNQLFARYCDLETHLRRHTREQPFNCPHCDKPFSSKRGLRRHVLKIHGMPSRPLQVPSIRK